MGLSLTQRREADRQQRHGRTLREIAASIGATYEQVCLSLFGGIHDWEPRIGTPVVMEGVNYREKVHDRKPVAAIVAGHGIGVAARDDAPVVRAAPKPLPPEPIAGARCAPEPAEPPPAPQPAAAPQPAPEPPRPQVPHAHPAPVAAQAPTASPAASEPVGNRYYLTDEAGQWLHESTEALTKNKRYAWKGTTKQIAAILQRAPKWRVLVPERAPG